MTFPPPILRFFAAALPLAAVALAQDPDPPRAGDADVATWATRLEAKIEPWVSQLAATGTDALPVLDRLVAHENEYVRYRAHAVIGRLGSTAIPLEDRLWELLRKEGGSWSARQSCVMSLGAIGTRRPEIQQAIVELCVTTPVAALRHTCSRTLQTLTGDAAAILLPRAAKGGFRETDEAVALLADLGEDAVATLVAALAKDDDAGGIARLALPRIGWKAVSALERAGERELACTALVVGPQHDVSGAEDYRIEVRKQQPPLNRLPTFEFETGSGHGQNLTLWRAREGRGGLVVDRITVVRPRERAEGAPEFELTAERAIVPRIVAFAFARQIVALRHMVAQPPEAPESWSSTGNFHARTRAVLDGELLLDEKFTGYPRGNNVEARFRAEAARIALFQMSHDAAWTPRAIADEDRKRIAARARNTAKDTWWVRERLAAMAKLVRRAARNRGP